MSSGDFDSDDERAMDEKSARQFLAEATGDDRFKDTANTLHSLLRDGIVLCQVLNSIKPGAVLKIQNSKLPLVQINNITAYCNGCKRLPGMQMYQFTPTDLVENRNMHSVILNVLALKRQADQIKTKLQASSSSSSSALSKSTTPPRLQSTPTASPRVQTTTGTPRTSAVASPRISPSTQTPRSPISSQNLNSPRRRPPSSISTAQSTVQVLPPEVGPTNSVNSPRIPLSPQSIGNANMILPSASSPNLHSYAMMSPGGSTRRSDVTTRDEDQKVMDELKYSTEMEDAVREWMCNVLGRKDVFSGNMTFAAALQNGVILCELLNVLKPGSVPKIHRQEFMCMQNIMAFLRVCQWLGMPPSSLCSVGDLKEGKNANRVLGTVYALAQHAVKRRLTDVPIRDTSTSKTLFTQVISEMKGESSVLDEDAACEPCAPEHRSLLDWANRQLEKGMGEPCVMRNFGGDVRSGVKLLRLAEAVMQEGCVELYYETPSKTIECMHNACALLRMIVSRTGTDVGCCSANNIVNGSVARVVALVMYMRSTFDRDYAFMELFRSGVSGSGSSECGTDSGDDDSAELIAMMAEGRINFDEISAQFTAGGSAGEIVVFDDEEDDVRKRRDAKQKQDFSALYRNTIMAGAQELQKDGRDDDEDDDDEQRDEDAGKTKTETKTESETEPEAETKAESKVEPEAEAEEEAEEESEAEAEAETEAKAEVKAEVEAMVESKVEPKADADSESDEEAVKRIPTSNKMPFFEPVATKPVFTASADEEDSGDEKKEKKKKKKKKKTSTGDDDGKKRDSRDGEGSSHAEKSTTSDGESKDDSHKKRRKEKRRRDKHHGTASEANVDGDKSGRTSHSTRRKNTHGHSERRECDVSSSDTTLTPRPRNKNSVDESKSPSPTKAKQTKVNSTHVSSLPMVVVPPRSDISSAKDSEANPEQCRSPKVDSSEADNDINTTETKEEVKPQAEKEDANDNTVGETNDNNANNENSQIAGDKDASASAKEEEKTQGQNRTQASAGSKLDASLPKPVLPTSSGGNKNWGTVAKRMTLTHERSSSRIFTVSLEQMQRLKEAQVKMRERVAREILSTEQSYVTSLNTLCDKVLMPLLRAADEASGTNADDDVTPHTTPLTRSDLKYLFLNAEELRTDHRIFLGKLEERFKDFDVAKTPICDIFLNQLEIFMHYKPYLQGYASASTAYHYLYAHNPHLKKLVDEFEKAQYQIDKLNVPSFLVMPVQRLPRYVMLLNDLQKYTSREHPDADSLREICNKLPPVVAEINTTIDANRAASMQANVRLAETISGEGVDLIVRCERKLELNCPHKHITDRLEGLKREKKHKRGAVLVFNDLIVLCGASTSVLQRGSNLQTVALIPVSQLGASFRRGKDISLFLRTDNVASGPTFTIQIQKQEEAESLERTIADVLRREKLRESDSFEHSSEPVATST